MEKYNIALVFDSSYNQAIIDYATKFYNTIESEVILGVNARPHLTIAQFQSTRHEATRIWNEFNKLEIPAPSLTLTGLTILPSSSGGAWIEISALKTKELIEVQEGLVAILNEVNGPSSGVGNGYRPHITVGHMLSGNEIANVAFDYSSMRAKNLSTSFEIGLGERFMKLEG